MTEKKRTRTYELKEKLFKAACAGESSRTPAEMIALIQEYTRRGREIPPEHEEALEAIDDEEARGVRALNLREEAEGSDRRWTGQLKYMKPINATLN